MGCNRILARTLHQRGELKRVRVKGKWTSVDVRPRDEFGFLQGYCSRKEAERRTDAENLSPRR